MKNCTIITVAQQKGGSGKTTIAAHIAVALSQMGNKVAVIDIDPQGSLSEWHKLRENKFGEDFTGLNFISKPGWRINSEISSLKAKCDYIVIDVPPHNDTDSKTAIRSSDLVIIPVQPSPTDLWATKTTKEFCEQCRVSYKILLNRVPPSSKIMENIIKELPSSHILKTNLGNRNAFAASIMEGKCITEILPSSTAAIEIKELVSELKKILHPKEKKTKAAA